MFVKINGVTHYLWRAVDQGGEVLESYITKKRNKKAALRFMKKALKNHGPVDIITTDGLHSHRAAISELGNQDRQKISRWANNKVVNWHLPFRRRERVMQLVRAPRQSLPFVHETEGVLRASKIARYCRNPCISQIASVFS